MYLLNKALIFGCTFIDIARSDIDVILVARERPSQSNYQRVDAMNPFGIIMEY